jgi:hypothetical protein
VDSRDNVEKFAIHVRFGRGTYRSGSCWGCSDRRDFVAALSSVMVARRSRSQRQAIHVRAAASSTAPHNEEIDPAR